MTVARVVAVLLGSAPIGVVINRFEHWFETPERLRPVMGGAPREGDCCADGPQLPRRDGAN